MSYYYDTSALCQNYHREAGSTKDETLLADQSARHVISRLTHLEIQSAFALKVRTGEIASTDFHLLRKRFRADVNQRRFVVVRLLRRHFDQAEKLIVKYGPTVRLRTMDALHLSIALDLCETNIAKILCVRTAYLCSWPAKRGWSLPTPGALTLKVQGTVVTTTGTGSPSQLLEGVDDLCLPFGNLGRY